jgi:hypothetical protein
MLAESLDEIALAGQYSPERADLALPRARM